MRGRVYVAWVIASAITAYLVAVVGGLIAPENRLSTSDLGLVVVGAVLVGLLRSPAILHRLTSRRVGGPDSALAEIRHAQEQQQRDLSHVRFLLRYLLSVEEHTHLQALREGKGDGYRMWQPLRIELVKLRRLGMIKPVQGRRIEDVPDRAVINLGEYFELTSGGLEYIRGTEAVPTPPDSIDHTRRIRTAGASKPRSNNEHEA
jgi:hypothetical protein